MAKKPTLDTIESGYQSTASFNSNFTALRDAFDNTLSLDGSTPNAMNAALDLNNNNILNIDSFQANSITLGGQTVNLTDIQTLTTIAGDIQRLADIEDGTLDTNAIQEVATIYSDVSTVSGIASNVTTVAGNTTNINTVAGINANVTTVAGLSGDVTTVSGISADVTTVAADGVDIGVVAGISTDVTTVSGINADVTTVSGISANVTTVAGNTTNINTVASINAAVTTVSGISSDVSTVSGISANVTTVASNITNVNTVATNIGNLTTLSIINSDVSVVAGIATDVTTVAGISSDVTAVSSNNLNITTVANISTDVSAVSAIDTNVTTVAGISGNVTTVAGVSTSIPTVAGISTDVTTVAGISGNVTTVAGVSTDVTTVAGISTDVTTVATNNSNVTTVAGISANVTTVAGIASDVTTVASDSAVINTVATAITDVSTVSADIASVITAANDLNEAVSEIETVAASITNVDLVGADITNVNTVATSISNVNTTAGSITNVNTVSGSIANVNTVATNILDVNTVAGISSDVTTVAADGTDIGTVATDIANVNTVAGSIVNVNTTATNISDVTTVAGEIGVTGDVTIVAAELGAGGAVTNVSAAINNVITVSQNLANVNNFAEVYRISANAPTTSLNTGDLWYDTLNTALNVYDGSQWTQGVLSGSGFLPLTGGTMSGDISMAGNDIYTNNGDLQMGTGIIYGNTFSGNAITASKLQALSTNPTNDSIVFFDTSAGNYAYLTIGSNLTLSGTTLSADTQSPTAGAGITVSGTQVNHADTSSQASVNNSDGTVIQDITIDTFGHITGIQSNNLDNRFLRSDADDTASGNITFSNASGITIGEADIFHQTASTWRGITVKNNGDTNEVAIDGQSSDGTQRLALYGETSSQGFLNPTNNSWKLRIPTSGSFTRDNTYTIWDSGNDGSGSGLDADLLDGYHLSTTRNAANTVPVRDGSGYLQLGWINTTSGATTSTVNKIYASTDDYIRYVTPATLKSQFAISPTTSVSGNYGSFQIDGGGYGGWEGYSIGGRVVFMHDNASAAGIYDDVNNKWMFYGGLNGSSYLYHNGNYKIYTTSTGVEVVGGISINDSNTQINEGGANSVRLQTNNGYVDIGPMNTSYAHIQTDMSQFYFNKQIVQDGNIIPYTDSTRTLGSSSNRWSALYADTLYGDGSNLTNLPSGTSSSKYVVDGYSLTSGTGGASSGWDTDGDNNTTPSDALNYIKYGDIIPLNSSASNAKGLFCDLSGTTIGGLQWAQNSYLHAVVNYNGWSSRWITRNPTTTTNYGSLKMDSVEGLVFQCTDPSSTIVGYSFDTVFAVDGKGATCSAFNAVSDIKLKENIELIDDPVAKLQGLNGYSYNFKATGRSAYGVIAQEVEEVLPHAVSESKEVKTVDYNAIVALLVETVKKQEQRIAELEKKVGAS